MPYFAVGGAVIGGALGVFGGMSEAESQYNAEVAAYNDRTLKESWAAGKQLFGAANANAMKRIQNSLIAEQLSRNYAEQQIALQKNVEDRREAMAESHRLQKATTNAMLSNKIGLSSGTAEAIQKQMEMKGAKNWENEFFNTLDEKKSMENQYRNNMNQIDDTMVQADAYLPGMPPAQPNMLMAGLMGGLSGAMSGVALGGAIGGLVGSTPTTQNPSSPPVVGSQNTSSTIYSTSFLGGGQNDTLALGGSYA